MGVTMKHIEQWLALYPKATDIHLTEGGRVIVREYGGLKELEERAEKSFFDMLFHSCLSPDKRKVYENGLRRLQNYPPALSFFQALQEAGKAPPWQEHWKESARKKRVTS